MPSLKEAAKNYESQMTKNIADLDKVSVDVKIEERTFNAGTEEEFTINVTKVANEDYRIPNSVLKQLRVHLEKNPKMKFFSVVKEGEGLKTSYTVVPAN